MVGVGVQVGRRRARAGDGVDIAVVNVWRAEVYGGGVVSCPGVDGRVPPVGLADPLGPELGAFGISPLGTPPGLLFNGPDEAVEGKPDGRVGLRPDTGLGSVADRSKLDGEQLGGTPRVQHPVRQRLAAAALRAKGSEGRAVVMMKRSSVS